MELSSTLSMEQWGWAVCRDLTTSCWTIRLRVWNKSGRNCEPSRVLKRSLRLFVLTHLVHVADGSLIEQQVGTAVAVYFETDSVIPFDQALHLFAILQYQDDRSLALHLLLIV